MAAALRRALGRQTEDQISRQWAGQWRYDALSGGTSHSGTVYWGDMADIIENDTYNFQSNPLSKETIQQMLLLGTQEVESGYPRIDDTTYYAYWDQSKYYQQMAAVDRVGYGTLTNGRVSYTDYVTSGNGIGNVAFTYSSANTTFVNGYGTLGEAL